MSKFQIVGGRPISGTVTASGNKNAALPMLAAAMLSAEPVTLRNIPPIRDVDSMLLALEYLGATVEQDGSTVRITASDIHQTELSHELCSRIRTSFLFVAPLLHRVGRAKVYPPGGDVIGRRRLDAHFYGLTKLGADADEHGFAFSTPNGMHGADLFFDEASVTATEHILMAAVLAKGTTTIRNAASEPHVQNLARMLNAMGARITGLNTNTLTVEGVDSLHGADVEVESDHIEVGSFLALAAATGGELTVTGTVRSHYWMINRVFERFGLHLQFGQGTITLAGNQQPHIQQDVGGMIPCISDGPWPQFPSDLMSSILVLATQTEGTVLIFEKMFESRLYFADPLKQMGASIIVCDPHRVVVSGRTQLRGQHLRSPDIRAGIALVSAALCADGMSYVDNAEIIDRGYQAIENRLQALGGHIERVD